MTPFLTITANTPVSSGLARDQSNTLTQSLVFMLFCVVGLSKMDIQELGKSCLLLCFDFESNNRLCENEMNRVYERDGEPIRSVCQSLRYLFL